MEHKGNDILDNKNEGYNTQNKMEEFVIDGSENIEKILSGSIDQQNHQKSIVGPDFKKQENISIKGRLLDPSYSEYENKNEQILPYEDKQPKKQENISIKGRLLDPSYSEYENKNEQILPVVSDGFFLTKIQKKIKKIMTKVFKKKHMDDGEKKVQKDVLTSEIEQEKIAVQTFMQNSTTLHLKELHDFAIQMKRKLPLSPKDTATILAHIRQEEKELYQYGKYLPINDVLVIAQFLGRNYQATQEHYFLDKLHRDFRKIIATSNDPIHKRIKRFA